MERERIRRGDYKEEEEEEEGERREKGDIYVMYVLVCTCMYTNKRNITSEFLLKKK